MLSILKIFLIVLGLSNMDIFLWYFRFPRGSEKCGRKYHDEISYREYIFQISSDANELTMIKFSGESSSVNA